MRNLVIILIGVLLSITVPILFDVFIGHVLLGDVFDIFETLWDAPFLMVSYLTGWALGDVLR